MAGTAYQQLVDAVGQYYGVGSDQWVEIAKYGINADNCAQILSQTPNVSVTVSKSGKVLSYTVDDVISTATQGATSAINSNTQIATMTSRATAKLPANMTVDTTGKVVAESGLKTVSTGSTVAATVGKVAVGVGAVAAGVQLGAAIDSALYNANPDFWDENGMSSINPQTWDSIASTEGGKAVFNMIFGIDKDTGATQPYMQQEALAQIAQYLAAQGAFSEGHSVVTEYVGGYSLIQPLVFYDVPNVGELTNENIFNQGLTILEDDNNLFKVGANVSGKKLSVCMKSIVHEFTCCDYSDAGLVYIRQYRKSTGEQVGGGDLTTNIRANLDGNPFYWNMAMYYSASITTPLELSAVQLNNNDNPKNTSLFILYGTSQTVGGVDGITTQSGATVPSGITSEMTTAEVIARLQELYPDLFNRAITNEVVQPDGSVETFTYVPVGFPDDVPQPDPTSGLLQPTGGIGTSQGNDTITENSPESLIETFLDIFTTPDPYDPTQTESPEDYPDTGDGVTPTPVIPTGSTSALYSIYNPSQTELNTFGAWLWSNDFVDQLKKIFNDPMQAIIGLHKIFATPVTSGTGTIKVGYLNSNVSANLVSNQYTTIDCGTVNLYEYFGNALDYTQTEAYLYLPFVGIVRLNTDDIMRGAINVVYKVDVLTGACLCSVNVTRDLSGGQIYTYSGNCAVQYPLSSGSYMGIVSGLLGIAGGVVGAVASGGAMLPIALGVGASAIGGMKTRVEHSGSIGGNSGAMGIKTPYFIIRRPQTAIADNFRDYNGASQNKYVSVGSLSGAVRALYVHLENIEGATGEEMRTIENELKNGILI